jgi:nucleoid-associated protein YgaU
MEHMFPSSLPVRIVVLAVFVLALWALFARSSGAAGQETHYRVKPGDTLWSIASEIYRGDPREGVWKIADRNHLAGTPIMADQVLVIP